MKRTKLNSFLSPSNGTVTLWEVSGEAQGPDEVNYRFFLVQSADHKISHNSQRKTYAINIFNNLRRNASQLNNGAW